MHLLFKNARLCYSLRIACPNQPPIQQQPPSHTAFQLLSSGVIPSQDATLFRTHYPMTRSWNTDPTRSWGHPPLHIDNLASLLKPWSNHTFPVRELVGIPRPLSLSSLPTKADYSPDRVFHLPPSNNEVFLFSDGSKTGRRVGAAFIHFYPPAGRPTTRSHLQSTHSIPPRHPLPTLPALLLGPTYSLSHGTCLYLMQSYMLPAARFNMPHLSLPPPKSSA